MKKATLIFVLCLLVGGILFYWIYTRVQKTQSAPIAVSVETSSPGFTISPRMMGLSYETSLLCADSAGHRYFTPDDQALVNLFKTIGIKSLRIGGSSLDALRLPVPTESDIESLFEFAKKADVKVLYSVRLADSKEYPLALNIQQATMAAKLIHEKYREQLDLFAMGNEPWYFLRDHDAYVAKWKIFRDTIVSVCPEARFCAADEGPSPDLIRKMANAYGGEDGRLVTISQHTYPFGSSYQGPVTAENRDSIQPFDAAEARARMLSAEVYGIYEKIYRDIVDAIDESPLPFRFTECNSYSSSGLKGASDSYASALWAVDYMHWWAKHGVDGMNFHTGNRTGGELNFVCRYAAFRTGKNGYDVYPLSYGMKLFDLGAQGKTLPTAVDAETNPHIAAYATTPDGKTVLVTLINKSFGPDAKTQTIKIRPDRPLAEADLQTIALTARNNDVSGSVGDVMLGGEPIKEDGTWNGQWDRLPASAVENNEITIKMTPATAIVVKFQLK